MVHQASKAFFADRWIVQQVSIATKLLLHKVVTTVARLIAGYRAFYKNDLVNMDVSYRKFWRQIVGLPLGTTKFFFPPFFLAALHAKPAEMDEVVQMKFPSLLVFSSVHPISKILESTTRD